MSDKKQDTPPKPIKRVPVPEEKPKPKAKPKKGSAFAIGTTIILA